MLNNLILFYSKQYSIRVNNPKVNPIVYCTLDGTVLLYTEFFWVYYQNTVQFWPVSKRIQNRNEMEPGRLYSGSS